jgi:hypothetical protein
MKSGNAVVIAVGAACIVVLAWRLPDIRRSGTHAAELSGMLGRPVPPLFLAAAGSGRPESGGEIYYVYAESCAWCGMDRTQVRRASMTARAPGGPAPFTAVSFGKSRDLEPYWRELAGLPLPDRLASIGVDAADSIGIVGVPLLVVVREGIVRAAWLGHLRWPEADTRRAIECRLGRPGACSALFVTDLARGFRGRLVPGASPT